MKLFSLPLLFLQGLKPYRALGRRLIQGRVHCCIPTTRHARSFSRVPGYEEIARNPTIHGGSGHLLIATLGRRVVGALSLLCFPREDVLHCPDWWIFGMTVRARYRGLGIGQELLQKALKDAASAGAVRVHVIVFERNARAINLYQKMGFRLNPAPELDDRLQGQFQHTSGEIIMSVPVGASTQSNDET